MFPVHLFQKGEVLSLYPACFIFYILTFHYHPVCRNHFLLFKTMSAQQKIKQVQIKYTLLICVCQSVIFPDNDFSETVFNVSQ